jgi:Mrp family chromosome partitioning ATPase
MSTNQSFIKAYRHDPARAAAPAPLAPAPAESLVRQGTAAQHAALQSSVQIVTADFGPAFTTATSAEPIIGKRPLSSFTANDRDTADDHGAQPPAAELAFRPETTISAFRWPRVCRALWEKYADQYDGLADKLVARCRREPGRGGLIGVSSLHAGDGCSTTLLCLAVALAARKTSVVLVDANFRSPRLAALLGAQPTTTWQDVLEQGLPVAEAVIRAESDHVDLLPLDARELTGHEPNGTKLAAGLQTTITAGVLRYAYEVVLVDLGAVLAPRSYATMSHLIRNMRVDANLLITNPRNAKADDLTIAGELLDETGCELLGLIENRTNGAR